MVHPTLVPRVVPDVAPFAVLLARRVLTTITGGELQRLAIGLIEHGHDHPRLHELAWEPVTAGAEAEWQFDSAAVALGLSMPSRSQAVEILVHHHTTRIVAGQCEPQVGLAQMMRDAYWPEVSKHSSSVYVGDSHDMQDLIGAYWSYGDLRDSPDVVGYAGFYGDAAFRAFGDEVRRIASDWLNRHPSPHSLLA